jgi:thiol-disulfide isomerase/thioredoxin
MESLKKNLPWIIRIIVGLLFIVSAIAKLYPSPYFAISTFEVKQLYPMGFTEQTAAYFSRILIGIEFCLGVLMLQNNFLRKIVIPATLLMLIIFTTHLTIVSFLTGGNSGNCGCFGSLIPMTPIQAIIKNIIAIILLGILLYILPKKENQNQNFWILSTTALGFILMLFMLAPMQQTSNFTLNENVEIPEINTDASSIKNLETPIAKEEIKTETQKIVKTLNLDSIKKTASKTEIKITKAVSGYAKYFSNIDSGKQTVCFFVPGCEHCRATAKELTELKKQNPSLPNLSILFMDEEANLIPEFFQFAGAEYPYKIIDVIGFWKVLGTNKDVPGVKFLQDGKEIKYYFGTSTNKFDRNEYKKLVQ